MKGKTLQRFLAFAVLAAAFLIFWNLRAWNILNGDGQFCTKTVIGERLYAIALNRSTLTLLTYRGLYTLLHGWFDWWPRDAIALGACLSGVVFLALAMGLGRRLYRGGWKTLLPVALPISTYLLQVYCGEVEFYALLNTALMLYAFSAWHVLHGRLHPVWASAALAVAAGCHTSGLFSFPSLLWLHALWIVRRSENGPSEEVEAPADISEPDIWAERRRTRIRDAALALGLFALLAITHRNRLWWSVPGSILGLDISVSGPIFGLDIDVFREASRTHLLFPIVICAVGGAFFATRYSFRRRWMPWLILLAPWVLFFTLRSAFNFHPEPILSHIAPVYGPYDPLAYLYTFFSWDHLHDKLFFHAWSAPFGVPVLVFWLWQCWKKRDCKPWVSFLLGMASCALAWTTLFYPQLRTGDWDLFVSLGLPLNLLLAHAIATHRSALQGKVLALAVLTIHLLISVPFVIDNSELRKGRGYCELTLTSELPAELYIRGLKVGETPFHSRTVRSGDAELRIIPLERPKDGRKIRSHRIEMPFPVEGTRTVHAVVDDFFPLDADGTAETPRSP